MRVRLLLLAAAAAVPACSSPPAATPAAAGSAPDVSTESRGGPLDDTVHVQLGRSAAVDGGRLVLSFTGRLSDSRCPANVVCVWIGDAAVRVAARVGRTTVERDLHTALEPHNLSIDRYVVTVVGLLPYPGTDDRSTPTAILRVERR